MRLYPLRFLRSVAALQLDFLLSPLYVTASRRAQESQPGIRCAKLPRFTHRPMHRFRQFTPCTCLHADLKSSQHATDRCFLGAPITLLFGAKRLSSQRVRTAAPERYASPANNMYREAMQQGAQAHDYSSSGVLVFSWVTWPDMTHGLCNSVSGRHFIDHLHTSVCVCQTVSK